MTTIYDHYGDGVWDAAEAYAGFAFMQAEDIGLSPKNMPSVYQAMNHIEYVFDYMVEHDLRLPGTTPGVFGISVWDYAHRLGGALASGEPHNLPDNDIATAVRATGTVGPVIDRGVFSTHFVPFRGIRGPVPA